MNLFIVPHERCTWVSDRLKSMQLASDMFLRSEVKYSRSEVSMGPVPRLCHALLCSHCYVYSCKIQTYLVDMTVTRLCSERIQITEPTTENRLCIFNAGSSKRYVCTHIVVQLETCKTYSQYDHSIIFILQWPSVRKLVGHERQNGFFVPSSKWKLAEHLN